MNIVVTRLQNIGDMLVFVPALRTLRRLYPEAHITLLGKHAPGLEIIRNCPYIDEVMQIRRKGLREKLRIVMDLRRRKVDLFIVSPQDQGKVPWGVLAGARRIAACPTAFIRDAEKREKWLWAITHRHEFSRQHSETENAVELIRATSSGAPPADLVSEYSWFAAETPDRVRAALREAGCAPDRPLAVSALFSKDPSRNWPLENFLELFQYLREELNLQVVLIGSAADAPECRRLAEKSPGTAVLAGRLSLDESAWLLKESAVYVGADSGPAHLASAVGCPAVVFYRADSYARWRVPAPAAKRRDLLCPEADLRNLAVKTVIEACREVLGTEV